MEAYKIKYGTKVVITDEDIRIPPDSLELKKGDIITIHKLDGMYCNGIDADGNRIYIAAWTEVEPINK